MGKHKRNIFLNHTEKNRQVPTAAGWDESVRETLVLSPGQSQPKRLRCQSLLQLIIFSPIWHHKVKFLIKKLKCLTWESFSGSAFYFCSHELAAHACVPSTILSYWPKRSCGVVGHGFTWDKLRSNMVILFQIPFGQLQRRGSRYVVIYSF